MAASSTQRSRRPARLALPRPTPMPVVASIRPVERHPPAEAANSTPTFPTVRNLSVESAFRNGLRRRGRRNSSVLPCGGSCEWSQTIAGDRCRRKNRQAAPAWCLVGNGFFSVVAGDCSPARRRAGIRRYSSQSDYSPRSAPDPCSAPLLGHLSGPVSGPALTTALGRPDGPPSPFARRGRRYRLLQRSHSGSGKKPSGGASEHSGRLGGGRVRRPPESEDSDGAAAAGKKRPVARIRLPRRNEQRISAPAIDSPRIGKRAIATARKQR